MDLDLPEGGTVETAWKAVVTHHPQLEQYRPFTLFAVGHDYVEPDHTLKAGDELLLFPPVSGGSGPSDIFAVVEHPLSPDDIAARVDDPGAGGLVIFSGVLAATSSMSMPPAADTIHTAALLPRSMMMPT